jgi:dihydroorotate dehydrogenase electron transfer subunit
LIDEMAEIAWNNRVADRTFLMGLKSEEIASASGPGQFVMIKVNEGMDPLLRRPFSICGVREDGFVFILYRVVGKGTTILSHAGKGERIRIMGPLGKGFIFSKSDRKPLLVGGGIGIAPLLFLAREMKDREIIFMAGFGTSKDIIDIHDLGDPHIRMSLATDDGSKGFAGTITELFEEHINRIGNAGDPFEIYACGPQAMLRKVVSMATAYDIPCQVSMEAFMACGLGACQGCAVKAASKNGQMDYHHVCREGPVFYTQEIDWNSQ